MATDSGVEGQALANRLLEALDAGQIPDWDALHSAYRRWLMYVAAGCLDRNGGLRFRFENQEELLNAFFAEKLLPPRQAQLILGATARGECPLRPRLAVSLRNFCIDSLRGRPPVRARAATDGLEMAEAPKDIVLPNYEDVADVTGRQLVAMRSCLPLEQRAPYRLAVLLRHRLDWSRVFDGAQQLQEEGGDPVELTIETLERLTVWEDQELRTRLGESLVSLGQSWELLRPRLLDAPDRRLSAADVAGTLRVPRDLWDQWVSRGRRRLRQQLGTQYPETFALWV
ncbi:MAG: hypothetical protein ACYC61_09620 [Isosphaeraceae bacterium]